MKIHDRKLIQDSHNDYVEGLMGDQEFLRMIRFATAFAAESNTYLELAKKAKKEKETSIRAEFRVKK